MKRRIFYPEEILYLFVNCEILFYICDANFITNEKQSFTQK